MGPERHLIVVAPHPDDETFALGGTIHDHLRRGGSCEIVAVTDGEAADELGDSNARATMAARRDNERKAALALLGAGEIDVNRLGYPDRDVALHEEDLVGELYEVFNGQQQRFASCLVALPWRGDPHGDHRAAGRAGVRAAALSGLEAVETPIWGWYHLEWRRRLPCARLRRISISAEARDAKQAAVCCFRSQFELLPGARGPVLPPNFADAFTGNHEVILA